MSSLSLFFACADVEEKKLMEKNVVGVQSIPSRDFDASLYSDICPEGAWTGLLDRIDKNDVVRCALYFTDVVSREKYCLYVFRRNDFEPSDGGINFRSHAFEGDVFDLHTHYSHKKGESEVMRARTVNCEDIDHVLYQTPPLAEPTNH